MWEAIIEGVSARTCLSPLWSKIEFFGSLRSPYKTKNYILIYSLCFLHFVRVLLYFMLFVFTKGDKSKKMSKSTHCTVFNARTYLSPKNILLSAGVKMICSDMVLGVLSVHIRQMSNYNTIQRCILTIFQQKQVCEIWGFGPGHTIS